MVYFWMAVGIVAGVAIGACLTMFLQKGSAPVGDLVVDRSDEDGPLLFLELHTSLVQVENQKEVTLQVVHKNYLPHK